MKTAKYMEGSLTLNQLNPLHILKLNIVLLYKKHLVTFKFGTLAPTTFWKDKGQPFFVL